MVSHPVSIFSLDKMEAEGLLSANREKPGSRPEKTIYFITDKGMEAFRNKLHSFLEFEYRPVFSSDSVFYFSEYLNTQDVLEHLKKYTLKLKKIINSVQRHRSEILQHVPEDIIEMINTIFSHHLRHYQAELDWTVESINTLKGEYAHGKTKNSGNQ